MRLQKLASVMIIFLLILTSISSMAQEEKTSGFVDDSLQDMSIVLGSGLAGAVLGLSTLSFVEKPSDHMKNIAVGGAIGIVIGVGVVIFSQATKTTITDYRLPLNEHNFDSIKRLEFSAIKIVEQRNEPSVNFNFKF
jgi:ABC-type Fe3+ transport system permease subunit